MTVVVTFWCTDGVVVAADSMLTSQVDNMRVAHHTGKKIRILNGDQVFAFAGDLGLGERFQIMADSMHKNLQEVAHPLHYSSQLTISMLEQLRMTGIQDARDITAALAYIHGNAHHCCIFEGPLFQPRLLDENHFYCSLGSGMLSADPFLRFLVDIFCQNGPPNVREGIFLATWVVEHVIRTNPGGVAGPIRIGTLERNEQGNLAAQEIPDSEIKEQRVVIENACTFLKQWRDIVQNAAREGKIPPPPKP